MASPDPSQRRDEASERRSVLIVLCLLIGVSTAVLYAGNQFGWFAKDRTHTAVTTTGKKDSDSNSAAQGASKTGVALLDELPVKPSVKLTLTTTEGRLAYVDRETVSFQVRANEPCHLTLLIITLDDEKEPVLVAFPNANQPAAPLAPGVSIQVPSQHAIDGGLLLRIVPPHGRTLIRAIATKQPVRFSDLANDVVEGFAILDRAKIMVSLRGQGAELKSTIGALMKEGEWAIAEIVITTTEKK